MAREDGWFKDGEDPRRFAKRRTAAKNRITSAFLEAFVADFEEYGVEAIQAARLSDPVQYVKIAASLLPKDLNLTDGDGNSVGFIIVPAKNGTETTVAADAASIGVPGSH